MIFDVANALVNLWGTWKKDRELQAWMRLFISTFYSGFISLCGTMGLALIAKTGFMVSLGIGMVSCSVSVLSVMLRLPQGRSLMLSINQEVVKEYQKPEGETVIIGPDVKL